MEAEHPEDERGVRYVVYRVLGAADGASLKIPLMAFDTQVAAKEFAVSEAQWAKGIPPMIVQILTRIGVSQMAMNITSIATPDGVHRIELATSLPPPGGQGRLLKS